MPSSAQMLDQLALAAAQARLVSIAWHVVIVAVLVAISMGWKPSGRVAGALGAASCVSVGVVSALCKNPFNAVVFGALAAVLVATSIRDRAPVIRRFSIAGIAALAFGAMYPHFTGWPVGVVPCATLYVLGGATLSGFAPGGASFRWAVAIATLFYGAFGVLVLHVWIDAGLIIVHAMCIREAHAYSRVLRRAGARGLPAVHAKFDGKHANRSP